MKKILIISELSIIKKFIIPSILRLKQEVEIQFDCLIVTILEPEEFNELSSFFTHIFFNKYPSGIISKLPKLRFIQYVWGLRKLAKELPFYDIAHVNFHHFYYSLFTPIIRIKVKKFFISFYGSDFNDLNWLQHLGNQKSIVLADGVYVTQNFDLLSKIIKKYKIENTNKEIGILFPLMNSFELFENYCSKTSSEIAKQTLGIDLKYMIACGYSASPIVQHEKIIESLIKIKDRLKDFMVIFPMNYGPMAKITQSKVKDLLKPTGLNYRVIEEYLTTEEILPLRLAADIFIHIQTRDQLSFSMLEHLAAGSMVITGKWLPYNSLVQMGIYFVQIEKEEDLPVTLLDVINNLRVHLELCKKNRDIILNLTSWERNKWSWYKAYDLN